MCLLLAFHFDLDLNLRQLKKNENVDNLPHTLKTKKNKGETKMKKKNPQKQILLQHIIITFSNLFQFHSEKTHIRQTASKQTNE